MGSTYLRQRMKTLCLFLGLSLAILTFLNQETKALSFDSNGILFRDSRETQRIRNIAIKRNEKNRKKNKKITKSRNRKKKTKNIKDRKGKGKCKTKYCENIQKKNLKKRKMKNN